MKSFIQASINDTIIYLKVDDSIIQNLFNVFIDAGYTFEKIDGTIWDYNIEEGSSYEIDTEVELDEFIKTNNRAIEIKCNYES
jgi:hypothetical protein